MSVDRPYDMGIESLLLGGGTSFNAAVLAMRFNAAVQTAGSSAGRNRRASLVTEKAQQRVFFVQDPFTEEVKGPLSVAELKQWRAKP